MPEIVHKPGVSVVNYKVQAMSGWTTRVLLLTDLHWDHPKCDHRLLRKLLDDAKATGSLVIDNGDLFCAMQGRDDPRANDEKRPEHRKEHTKDRLGMGTGYYAGLVKSAADFFEPYAGHYVCMGTGNHETGIYRHMEYNLTGELIYTLKNRTGHQIGGCGYTGWVRFRFNRGTCRNSLVMWMGHGWGKRNFDVAVRQADADIYFLGHTHDQGQDVRARMRLTGNNDIEKRELLFIQGPSFKDGYGRGQGGFETEKGHGPKPIGAWWLTLGWEGDRPWADAMRAR